MRKKRFRSNELEKKPKKTVPVPMEKGRAMDVREKLVELQMQAPIGWTKGEFADYLIAHGVMVQECARPLEEWGEDYGDVLWWKFPIEEPPHVGSPLDADWPGYHTHWTPITLPRLPQED